MRYALPLVCLLALAACDPAAPDTDPPPLLSGTYIGPKEHPDNTTTATLSLQEGLDGALVGSFNGGEDGALDFDVVGTHTQPTFTLDLSEAGGSGLVVLDYTGRVSEDGGELTGTLRSLENEPITLVMTRQ